jgi:hypothetical protein
MGRLAAAGGAAGGPAHACGLLDRGDASVRPPAHSTARRGSFFGAAGDLVAHRSAHHRLDHRRHRRAGLEPARLSIRSRSRVMQQLERLAAQPHPPCQWLEESLVEAFSIRGVGRLADDWERDPPFPDDSAFSSAIRKYRSGTLGRYQIAGGEPAKISLAEWFKVNRADVDGPGGLRLSLGPAIVAFGKEYDQDIRCVEDLGALNRWPERTGLPIADYLTKWQTSCQQINASGHLPARVKALLGVVRNGGIEATRKHALPHARSSRAATDDL